MANRQKRTHVSRETCCERRQGRKMYAVFYLLHLPRTLCAPNRDRSARGAGRRRCTPQGRFCTKRRDVRRLEASKRAFQPSCRRSLPYSSDRYNIDQAFSKATKTARNAATDKVSHVASFCAETALRRARLLARNHRRRSQTLMTASTTCRREQHQQRQRECGLRYRRRGFWTRETQRS